MKKNILLFAMFFCSMIFAQKKGELKTEWSTWQKAAPCFPNLYISFKSNGWEPTVNKYNYNFRLKNTGNKAIHFNLDIKFSSGENYTADGRFDLAPGKEYTHVSMYYDTRPIPNANDFFTTEVTHYLENTKDDWTLPAYNCNGTQQVCAANCNDNNSTSNTNKSPTSQDYDTQLEVLLNERSKICECNNRNGVGTSLCGLSYTSDYYFRLVKDNHTPNQINNEKKEGVLELKNDLYTIKSVLGKCDSSVQTFEEEKQHLVQEKQEKYNSEISQGDDALQGEDYAGAMNHYQNAQNYATTDEEQSAAQRKYNQALEAKKTAERKIRVAEQNKRDETENVTYAATSATTITAMSLLEDSPSEGFTSGKIYLGLGIEQIPLISNNTSQYHTNKSYIEAPLVPGFDMGIILGIANNKKVSLYLNPRFSYGISAFSAGTSGGLFEYGGTAMLGGNWDREFPLKIFVEGGYFKRSATFHYDADASAADSGVSTSTDDVRDGEYNYSVIRYGGGLMFHQIDDDEEYTVKGGVFFDKPSFFPKDIKSNIGFNLQGIYNKLGSLEVYYSPNYFIGGNVLYPSTLEKENKAYFGIKFTRTGKLW